MKLKFTLVLFFFAVCGVCFAQTKQSEEEDVGRFVERYDNAWNHKDTAAIERILAPDYVYFSSKGQVRSRQSLLDELLSPNYKLASAERTEVKVYLTLGTAVVRDMEPMTVGIPRRSALQRGSCPRETAMVGSIRALHADCWSLIA